MHSFAEILEHEMKTGEFFSIVDQILTPISQEEQDKIIKEILELIEQDEEIQQYSQLVESQGCSAAQEAEFEEIVRLSIGFLKQSVLSSYNLTFMETIEEHEVDPLEGITGFPFVMPQAIEEEEMEEYLVEDEDLWDIPMDDDLEFESEIDTVDIVWSSIALKALECVKTKTAGAA